jgi:hypothetical protein
LVIKDFYNPTNKSLQELGFIVSIVKVCYRSIKTSFNEAGFIGSDNTGILTFWRIRMKTINISYLDLKEMLFHVWKTITYFLGNFFLTKTCMHETYRSWQFIFSLRNY